MWAYIPNLKRAVRVNMAQKLTGQAAIGDICRMRWFGDYKITEKKTMAKPSGVLRLKLEALKKGLTYDKINAYVSSKTLRPLSAEFLTKSGKPIKKATYGDFRAMNGQKRPHKILLEDYTKKDRKSTIRISSQIPKNIPDSLFSQRSLK